MRNSKSVNIGITVAVAFVLAIVVSVGIKGMPKPEDKNKIALKINKTKSLPKKTIDARRGIFTDLFDSTEPPGVPLDEALQKVGSGASLPDASVVGKPEKVVITDQDYRDTGKLGMGVLYDSGVKLWIQPVLADFTKILEQGFSPFTDGRKAATIRQKIARRETLVSDEGVQILSSKGKVKKFPAITWNMNGMNYILTTDSDDVSVDKLIRAAESIK